MVANAFEMFLFTPINKTTAVTFHTSPNDVFSNIVLRISTKKKMQNQSHFPIKKMILNVTKLSQIELTPKAPDMIKRRLNGKNRLTSVTLI